MKIVFLDHHVKAEESHGETAAAVGGKGGRKHEDEHSDPTGARNQQRPAPHLVDQEHHERFRQEFAKTQGNVAEEPVPR